MKSECSDEKYERVRNCYRVVHAAVQIAALRIVLEDLLPAFPTDIVREIAYQYYMKGGTIEELETRKEDRFVEFNHPAYWAPLNFDLKIE
jgi:hypothetical protein